MCGSGAVKGTMHSLPAKQLLSPPNFLCLGSGPSSPYPAWLGAAATCPSQAGASAVADCSRVGAELQQKEGEEARSRRQAQAQRDRWQWGSSNR